jgi:hypothetical protein
MTAALSMLLSFEPSVDVKISLAHLAVNELVNFNESDTLT